MRQSVWICLLALAWLAMSGGFSLLNLILGIAIAALVANMVWRKTGGQAGRSRLSRLLHLVGLFVYELFAGAFGVAALVLTPGLRNLRPAIVAFPLSAKSAGEITTLANLITLTPGTLSLDVSPDRKFLYIHVLNLQDRDALLQAIATGFEKQVVEVFR